jgi:hypothetical protein
VGKPEGRRSLGRRRHRQDTIKIDLRETGWEGMNWFDLADNSDRWRAFVQAVMNFCFHKMRGIS